MRKAEKATDSHKATQKTHKNNQEDNKVGKQGDTED